MVPQHGILELSASRMCHNLDLFRHRIPPGTRICAMLKANGYGHGAAELLPPLRAAGIPWIGLYTVHEALELLPAAADFSILAVAPLIVAADTPLPEADLQRLVEHQVRVCLTDIPSARRLAEQLAARRFSRPLPVHVQVDTGMTRAGVSMAEAPALFAAIEELPALRLEGLFAHPSHADVPGHDTFASQLRGLHAVATPVRQRRPDLLVHLQPSGGAWHCTDPGLNLIRLGISLYGLQPSYDHPIPGVQPIARLRAPIIALHDCPVGTGVGYDHTFVTARPSRLAIVPVGYADGYPRALTNRGIVQVRGRPAPVVGKVSMDQTILDVTDIPAAALGDWVTLMDWTLGAPNSIDALAQTLKMIPHQIITALGQRLRRRVVE